MALWLSHAPGFSTDLNLDTSQSWHEDSRRWSAFVQDNGAAPLTAGSTSLPTADEPPQVEQRELKVLIENGVKRISKDVADVSRMVHTLKSKKRFKQPFQPVVDPKSSRLALNTRIDEIEQGLSDRFDSFSQQLGERITAIEGHLVQQIYGMDGLNHRVSGITQAYLNEVTEVTEMVKGLAEELVQVQASVQSLRTTATPKDATRARQLLSINETSRDGPSLFQPNQVNRGAVSINPLGTGPREVVKALRVHNLSNPGQPSEGSTMDWDFPANVPEASGFYDRQLANLGKVIKQLAREEPEDLMELYHTICAGD